MWLSWATVTERDKFHSPNCHFSSNSPCDHSVNHNLSLHVGACFFLLHFKHKSNIDMYSRNACFSCGVLILSSWINRHFQKRSLQCELFFFFLHAKLVFSQERYRDVSCSRDRFWRCDRWNMRGMQRKNRACDLCVVHVTFRSMFRPMFYSFMCLLSVWSCHLKSSWFFIYLFILTTRLEL